MRLFYMAIIALFFTLNSMAQSVAKFDDLTLTPENFWNGSDQSGSFKSTDVTFFNSYNTSWQSWDGFAYSNTTDITTAGYGNQYSAITGKGFEESANYAVCYPSPSAKLGITLTGNITGFYVTNSTYAYLSMKNGDSFAKKFGGENGNDPDYFKLMIETIDPIGQPVDSLDFYLADFRSTDNSKDYILNNWTWIDLSQMKLTSNLRFSLSSSDNSFGFMNTPGYFCLDNLIYEIRTSAPEVQQIQTSVFPNPFVGAITISGLKGMAKVIIYDVSGRTVAKNNQVSNNQEINNLKNLNSGVYFIQISDGKNQFTTKLIKK